MRLKDADHILSELAELKKSPWFNEEEHKSVRKEVFAIIEGIIDLKEPVQCPDDSGEWRRRAVRAESMLRGLLAEIRNAIQTPDLEIEKRIWNIMMNYEEDENGRISSDYIE